MSREEIHSAFVRRFSVPRPKPVAPVTPRICAESNNNWPVLFLDLVTGGESEQRPEGAGWDVQEFFEPDEMIETHRLYSSGGMEDWLVPDATRLQTRSTRASGI